MEREKVCIDTVRAELERIWNECPCQAGGHKAGWGLRSDAGLIKRGGYWDDKKTSEVLVRRRGTKYPGGSHAKWKWSP